MRTLGVRRGVGAPGSSRSGSRSARPRSRRRRRAGRGSTGSRSAPSAGSAAPPTGRCAPRGSRRPSAPARARRCAGAGSLSGQLQLPVADGVLPVPDPVRPRRQQLPPAAGGHRALVVPVDQRPAVVLEQPEPGAALGDHGPVAAAGDLVLLAAGCHHAGQRTGPMGRVPLPARDARRQRPVGMRRALAALLLAAAVAGCGADDDAQPDADATEPSGPRVLEIADTYEQAGNPEWLHRGVRLRLGAGGRRSRARPRPRLRRRAADPRHRLPRHSRPARGSVTTRPRCGPAPAPDAMARIDPASGTLTRVPVAKRSDEGRLAFSGGLLWYLETGSQRPRRPRRHRRPRRRGSSSGEVCTDLAYDAELVFALCPTAHHVLRVDPASGSVDGHDRRREPAGQPWERTSSWATAAACSRSTPRRWRCCTPTRASGRASSAPSTRPRTRSGSRREGGTFLTGIDPAAHEVVGHPRRPGRTPSGGDVLISDDWIWATVLRRQRGGPRRPVGA